MKLGKTSFNLKSKGVQEMTKEVFTSKYKGVRTELVESYWREFSKEVAKFKPKKAKRVKKEEVIEEPKQDVKEG